MLVCCCMHWVLSRLQLSLESQTDIRSDQAAKFRSDGAIFATQIFAHVLTCLQERRVLQHAFPEGLPLNVGRGEVMYFYNYSSG